ncbi:MAG: protein-glutamate O-methyltransferase CheR [Desulfatirhabdiaceae bacterium]
MDKMAETEHIEIRLLLEAIFLKYGYDFRSYAEASIGRRIQRNMRLNGCVHISELQHRILTDAAAFQQLMTDLSVSVTEMFRNPDFYQALRRHVLPELLRIPFVKIWCAGCATGEEVYSLAILLEEEGIVQQVQIYATDINESALQIAEKGIYPLDKMKEYTTNYHGMKGRGSFADYYAALYDHAVLRLRLKKNMTFAHHNMVTDGSFGEMNLILCRNVMIYFNRDLQNRVFQLFCDSLTAGGFLCLGSKETLQYAECANQFENVNAREKIYRKKFMRPEL